MPARPVDPQSIRAKNAARVEIGCWLVDAINSPLVVKFFSALAQSVGHPLCLSARRKPFRTRGKGRWPSACGVSLGPWVHTALSHRLSLPL